jgi:prepilin-type N-terminal cleavage/methylation domain-containing protein
MRIAFESQLRSAKSRRPLSVDRILSAARATRGFTLLEVVIAVGIFGVAMIAVLGMFTSVTKSVGDGADNEAATAIAPMLQIELQRRVAQAQAFDPVTQLLKHSTARSHQLTDADNNPNARANDPRVDPQLLFISRDGAKIGGYSDPIWGGVDNEKFFEIALIRNEAVSPNDSQTDAASLAIAYTARIRWPAFVADGSPTNPLRALPAGYNPSAAVTFDHSVQRVLFVAGSVSR